MARILLTNDDGYRAPGIRALYDVLRDEHEVWLVAPERDRSATSHSISLHKPLRMEETEPRVWSISGSPVDCAYLALCHLMDAPPDIVLSGINAGPNLGSDVMYSGTVAAAMEGALHGHPAIAFSLNVPSAPLNTKPFLVAAQVASRMAEKVLSQGMPARTTLNVNVSPKATLEAEPELTRLCMEQAWTHSVDVREDPRGKPYAWIGGFRINYQAGEGTDTYVVEAGGISATPLGPDLSLGLDTDRFAPLVEG